MSRRIFHFTESLGGGVLSSLEVTCNIQSSSGYSVSIIFLRRGDTPSVESMKLRMPNVEFVELERSSLKGLYKMFLTTVKIGINFRSAILHAHSSWAGIVVRLACISILKSNVNYTPHGFGFLRADLHRIARLSILVTESVLSTFTWSRVMACGVYEAKLAKKIGSRNVCIVSNYLDPTSLPRSSKDPNRVQLVVAIGRLCQQKNPLRFKRVVSKVTFPGSFLWIGDGDSSYRSDLEDSKIEVTGWKSKQETLNKLSKASILVITSDWEGLPLVAIEAVALGVPIVAFYIESLEEIVHHERTGYLCKTEEDMVSAIEKILNSMEQREEFSKNSLALFESRYHSRILNENWREMYQIA